MRALSDVYYNTIEVHDIYKDSDFKRVTERQKCLLRTYSYNKKRLRKNEARAFKATWEKTGLVAIERHQLPKPHVSLEIGPVIVMGVPPP